MNAATIHVVDDDASFLQAISRLLRATGFAVQTYESAAALLTGLKADAPGCIVSDLNMPGTNGLQLQEMLVAQGKAQPILFLTGNGDIPSSVTAMKAGAVDFLEKRAPQEKLLEAIRRALSQGERDQAESVRRREVRAMLATLSSRELEVLEHVVSGKMNKEIAVELSIHERTVKLHRSAITTKLRAPSVAELTRIWLEAGY